MDAPGLVRLAAARMVALYLLSLLATAGADLAWRPPDLLRLAAHAVTLGLAVGLGRLAPRRALGGGRRRAPGAGAGGWPSSSCRCPASWPSPWPWPPPASPRRPRPPSPSCRWPCSSSPKLSPLEILALWGALVLDAPRGPGRRPPGPGGAHRLPRSRGRLLQPGSRVEAARRLAGRHRLPRSASCWRTPCGPSRLPCSCSPWRSSCCRRRRPRPSATAAAVRARARGAGAPTSGWCSWPWPGGGHGDPPDALAARRRERGSHARGAVESQVEAEELLEPAASDEARYEPARGRVIRAYLRFLSRAARGRLPPRTTPHPAGDPGPRRPAGGPAAVLTGLFMDARYGPDEPAPEAVRSAEAASHDVCSRCASDRARPAGTAGGRSPPGRGDDRARGGRLLLRRRLQRAKVVDDRADLLLHLRVVVARFRVAERVAPDRHVGPAVAGEGLSAVHDAVGSSPPGTRRRSSSRRG